MLKKFNNLKISIKLGLVFMVLLIAMGFGGVVGLYNGLKMSSVMKTLFEDTFTRTEILSSLERELLLLKQNSLYAIRSMEKGDEFTKNELNVRIEKIFSLTDDFIEFDFEADKLDNLENFKKELNSYKLFHDELFTSLSTGILKETDHSITITKLNMNFDKLNSSFSFFIESEREEFYREYQMGETFAQSLKLATIIFTFLAIVLAVALWLVLRSAIVKPIEILLSNAKSISQGDLTQRIQLDSKDELGILAKEFNSMTSNLQGFYKNLEAKVQERTSELEKANDNLIVQQQELETKAEELVLANNLKSQFLASVSHELRTPLNSIIGFSELLNEKAFGELNEKQEQYVNYIYTSGIHLLELINNILDLSKIEAGRMELNLEEFSLVEVLSSTLGSIKPLAYKRNISIDAKEVNVSPTIMADKGKFKQIMLNLLSNAVKYNKEGGSVEVNWSIKEEPVKMEMKEFLFVSVKDTGLGIKKEDKDRVFNEFEQLDNANTHEFGGTGLGLALTKRLVELHDGKIWFESEFGHGSVFYIKMPLQGSHLDITRGEENIVPSKTFYDQQSKATKILVASETSGMNNLISAYLTEEGYEVILADDGFDVIKKAKEEKPFAILLSIAIPKKDGFEVLKELKESAETKELPVVIISGSEEKDLGFSLGAIDCLVEPIDREKLHDVFERVDFAQTFRNKEPIILIVDDEPKVLELLNDVLIHEKFTVVKASGGQEAIEVAKREVPDVIILDLMMPKVSGFDVVDELKHYDKTKNIPIIIFSAKSITKEDKDRLGESIKNIIAKAGFSKKDLLEELKSLEVNRPEKANMIDSKTNLFNRRYMDTILEREIDHAEKYNELFTVSLIDIDEFVGFNKVYGVEAGDNILKELANIIKEETRNADHLARYGGDDFVVLMPGLKEAEASKFVSKIYSKIKEHDFLLTEGTNVNITVSIACAVIPKFGKDDIIERLHDAVREMQKNGGDRASVVS